MGCVCVGGPVVAFLGSIQSIYATPAVVLCYRAKNGKVASITTVLDTKRKGLICCKPPPKGANGLPFGTHFAQFRLSLVTLAGRWGSRLAARRTSHSVLLCACTSENTALAPCSALSQRTKNANTRAMRLLQAQARQKIVKRQCNSSGTGKGLATGCGYLPAWFSLASLRNRLRALPAFCSQEVSFALSLNVSGCRIRKQVRSRAVRSPFVCMHCWRSEWLH